MKVMFLSSLSSLLCSNASSIWTTLDMEEAIIIHCLRDILKSSKSLNEELQKVISYDDVEFFSKDELIVTLIT